MADRVPSGEVVVILQRRHYNKIKIGLQFCERLSKNRFSRSFILFQIIPGDFPPGIAEPFSAGSERENKEKRIMKDALPRRHFLKAAAGIAILPWGERPLHHARGDTSKQESPWQIGICDWNLKAKGDPKAFEIAEELGFQGVQVSYGPLSEKNLSQPATRKAFLEAAQKQKQGIASLAMGILNQRPLATDPEAVGWVSDCLDAMKAMDQKIVLLAFFGKGDLKGKPGMQEAAVRALKQLAPKAEKLGKILGLESYLNMQEHLKIIEAVGSDALKVYYDVANMAKMGYDIYQEMEQLGNQKLICQVHLKENGVRLGSGVVDFNRVRRTLEKIDYRGWLVAEGGVEGDWKESQRANAAFLKKTFGIA
jgi:sugar phosphate isomerase/epimerase